MRLFSLPSVAAAAFLGLCSSSAFAVQYNWQLTGTQTAADWNLPANWSNDETPPIVGFPNAAGDIANFAVDLTGAQLVRLRQAIRIGAVYLGDASPLLSTGNFTIANATGESFALTFDSGVAGTRAEIRLSSATASGNSNTINVPVLLDSDLLVNLGTADALNNANQTLAIGVPGSSNAGSLATGTGAAARNVLVTGGASGTTQFTWFGDVTGSGTITNSSNAAIRVSGVKSFTGTIVLNKGIGSSNTGSLTLTTGRVANAAEIIINGYLSNGATQNGGSVHAGDNSAAAVNPGQRLTQNKITLNGGSLAPNGQALSATVTGGTLIQENVNTVRFNSSYSLVNLGTANSGSTGTRLIVAGLERSAGASAFLRGASVGVDGHFTVGNISSHLKGGGGADGPTTLSIIPWMLVNNTNASASAGDTFATYSTDGGTYTGIRGLVTTTGGEYATSLTAGATGNVTVSSVAVANPDTELTVNSLRYTNAGATNIGAAKVLNVASGGVIFTTASGSIGASGNATAGTLQFGTDLAPAEGVVWANGTNTNTIGAAIDGAAGLSKAGTGTLTLTGTNIYTGLTYVGGGTLQVGNGVNNSNLGLTGDVSVAAGATLSLFNSNAIADTGTLTLQSFGLFNGKLNLNGGVTETVGGLYLGDVFYSSGTFGGAGSGAAVENSSYFTGGGVLTVIPEPGTLTGLLGGAAILLARRRRR